MKKVILTIVFLGAVTGIGMADASLNLGAGLYTSNFDDGSSSSTFSGYDGSSSTFSGYGTIFGLGWAFDSKNIISAGFEVAANFTFKIHPVSGISSNQYRLFLALAPREELHIIVFGGLAWDMIINDNFPFQTVISPNKLVGVRLEYEGFYGEFATSFYPGDILTRYEFGLGFAIRWFKKDF